MPCSNCYVSTAIVRKECFVRFCDNASDQSLLMSLFVAFCLWQYALLASCVPVLHQCFAFCEWGRGGLLKKLDSWLWEVLMAFLSLALCGVPQGTLLVWNITEEDVSLFCNTELWGSSYLLQHHLGYTNRRMLLVRKKKLCSFVVFILRPWVFALVVFNSVHIYPQLLWLLVSLFTVFLCFGRFRLSFCE